MMRELKDRAVELIEPVTSIYFGGGTPSLLEPKEIAHLLKTVRNHYQVDQDIEITLECNPEDLSIEKLKDWKKSGINRLSIGVQSLSNPTLKWLNRQHTQKNVFDGLNALKSTGFTNFSVDYIFGIPGLETKQMKSELRLLLDFEPAHFSCYQLTVEPQTALAHQISKKTLEMPDENMMSQQFLEIDDLLTRSNYHHYEISNYALPELEAIHNTNYWRGVPYFGIGPGAHSYNGLKRRWNISNNVRYVKQYDSGDYYDEELLTPENVYNEQLILGLRTQAGLSMDRLLAKQPANNHQYIFKTIKSWETNQWIVPQDDRLILTPKGWLFSDYMAKELMI